VGVGIRVGGQQRVGGSTIEISQFGSASKHPPGEVGVGRLRGGLLQDRPVCVTGRTLGQHPQGCLAGVGAVDLAYAGLGQRGLQFG
jgi:hypothetical protein